jgi:hypothetical protein
LLLKKKLKFQEVKDRECNGKRRTSFSNQLSKMGKPLANQQLRGKPLANRENPVAKSAEAKVLDCSLR